MKWMGAGWSKSWCKHKNSITGLGLLLYNW